MNDVYVSVSVGRVMVEVLWIVLVDSERMVRVGRVIVLVFAVERMVDVWVVVVPFREVVLREVPWRSTRIVEVETGSVVVLDTTLVVWIVDEKV